MPIKTIIYNPSQKKEWDTFVETSKNGTFLFMRDYMEYHSDRFKDCSLMFYREKKLLAILPANISKENKRLESHGGLTYGGLIMSHTTRTTDVIEIIDELKSYMSKTLSLECLIYKPVPYIYNKIPSEEPLYALFNAGARISARSISTTIDNREKIRLSQQRKRGISRAQKAGITCNESTNYRTFWKILTEILSDRHNSKPVHTIEEIEFLHSRFPQNIKLFTADLNGSPTAGIIVYETERVAHFQYIASSDEGCRLGALDILVAHLTEDVYANKDFIDFGTSTEQGGLLLNTGLIRQKEGFGGRAVAYDTYELIV